MDPSLIGTPKNTDHGQARLPKKEWPIEKKDVKKQVLIEDVDRYRMYAVRQPVDDVYSTHKLISMTEESVSVPPPLGLTTYSVPSCPILCVQAGDDVELGDVRCEIS